MRFPIFSLLTAPTTMPSPSSSSSSSSSPLSTKPRKPYSSAAAAGGSHHPHNHHSSPLFCRHHSLSSTATLDLLILILVLFSGSFLLTSYFSYLFHSLSLLLSPLSLPQFPLVLAFLVLLLSFVCAFLLFFGGGLLRSRRCENPKCKGLKKAMEFDLQLQTEESLKSGPSDIDRLPWKGGTETNPDYECLRTELRKMAPPNGRAVLLFRAKCGCPVAKLVGWGPKKGRKYKKALANMAVNGDYL